MRSVLLFYLGMPGYNLQPKYNWGDYCEPLPAWQDGQCAVSFGMGNTISAYMQWRKTHNLLSLSLKLPQLIKIGTDLQFCIFCWVAIAFLIVVIENQ